MSVLMEHSQDVKCIAWHPKEEARYPAYDLLVLNFMVIVLRFFN